MIFAYTSNMFAEIFENLSFEDALVVTAPPGWGKTYKILSSIKSSHKRFCFIFPLRALCEEVYLAAVEKNISCVNLKLADEESLKLSSKSQLIITTPEQLDTNTILPEDFIFILDEFHLFYYWGDTFREKLESCLYDVFSFGPPLILLSATLSDNFLIRIQKDLELNYSNVHRLNFGNLELKNTPNKIYFYPKGLKNWIMDDLFFRKKEGTTLVFCAYRSEVKKLAESLELKGFKTLSCVGGEAKEFTDKLSVSKGLDFIVATSVVSHGVNLPHISEVYFTYKVENLDFYIQMLGRGGREGNEFSIHTQNFNYFKKGNIVMGIIRILLKRLSNKVESLIYCFYAY